MSSEEDGIGLECRALSGSVGEESCGLVNSASGGERQALVGAGVDTSITSRARGTRKPSYSVEDITNEYGNVDTREGVPDGYTHLTSRSASRECRTAGVPYAKALVRFDKVGGRYFPRVQGIVVAAADARALASARRKRIAPKARTQAQIARIDAMGLEALLASAIGSMHALNRRAKRYRGQADSIYDLKDRFLAAAVAAGRATLGRFEIERQTGWAHSCDECCRDWYASDEESRCRWCGEISIGAPATSSRVWYLVRVGDRGFHQPGPKPEFEAVAVPIEPHDPTNHNTEIPRNGLVIAAQKYCVELATVRLRELLGEAQAAVLFR